MSYLKVFLAGCNIIGKTYIFKSNRNAMDVLNQTIYEKVRLIPGFLWKEFYNVRIYHTDFSFKIRNF